MLRKWCCKPATHTPSRYAHRADRAGARHAAGAGGEGNIIEHEHERSSISLVHMDAAAKMVSDLLRLEFQFSFAYHPRPDERNGRGHSQREGSGFPSFLRVYFALGFPSLAPDAHGAKQMAKGVRGAGCDKEGKARSDQRTGLSFPSGIYYTMPYLLLLLHPLHLDFQVASPCLACFALPSLALPWLLPVLVDVHLHMLDTCTCVCLRAV